MTGKREDHMNVARREQFLTTRFDPAVTGSRLTFWTMSVPAAVIRDGGPKPAAGALVDMTAESGGATPRNGPQDFDVLPADPVTASFDECFSGSADDIGHLEEWPAHLLLLR